MMNNPSYPTFSPQSSQPIRPYTGTIPHMVPAQAYNGPTNDSVALGVPLLPNQMQKMPPQAHHAMPTAHRPQVPHGYVQLPQHQSPQVNHAASPYYTSQNSVQQQNSNIRDQNACYIELTDSTVPEPIYAPSEIKHDDNVMITNSTMPAIQYPQLSGPMTPTYQPYPYQMTPSGNQSGPIIYDATLLNGITSREPQLTHCQHCNKHVQTVVSYKAGKGAVISGVFMGCLGGVPLLCSWLPCVLKGFKDAVHHCPVCGEEIGTKKFLLN